MDPNDDEPEEIRKEDYQLSKAHPYQMKCCYKVVKQEIIEDDSSSMEGDDL